MHRLIFIIVITIIDYQSIAQTIPYQFSEAIIDTIAVKVKENPDKADYYYQEGAWELSFIGEHKSTLKNWDALREKSSQASKEDSLYFKSLKAVPAKDYIIKNAKNQQIVMLNEAHHIPQHRVFATSLLEEFYKLGFRYFGVESYRHKDSLLNLRKFPIVETGYYIKEPQFGNLIRTALELGFEIFPYEADLKYYGKDREIQQAKKIQQVLKSDPMAKIFVYAGFDHIREDSLFNSWEKAMAGWLKEYTGIDPFTIDQTEMTEKSHPKFENPFFRLNNNEEPVVYLDSSERSFAGSQPSKQYDVSVFHPRTNYIHGRPDWLLSRGGEYYFIPANKKEIDCPCLIFAYKKNENENAIPVDLIELKDKKEQKALVLPPGTFDILITNKQRRKVEFDIHLKSAEH